MRSRDSSTAWLTALALFGALALPLGFWRLGAVDVVTMEGIVADGARHMAREGDYFVPRLHGEIYAYKPPLAYWLALVSTRVLGESEWTLRLPFVLSGVAMGLAVLFVVGARLGPRVGLWCAVASLTGGLAIQKLRLAEFDMPLAAGVGIASILAAAELTSQRPRLWRWPAAYLALAFGFLAKGVPALMFFGPGLLAAAVLTGSWRRLASLGHVVGVATFALVAGGWVAGAWTAEGWAAFEQPFQEAGDKGFTWSLEAVGAALAKPLVAVAVFLPWTAAVPVALRRRVWRRLDSETRSLAVAAGGFALGGVLAFLLVPATETRYLLPIAAPAGVFGALVLQGVTPRARYAAVAVAAVAGIVQIAVVEPHRASSRSLRSVAERFASHLEPVGPVWVGPVSHEFRHSSLTYYLRRPFRTFSDGEPPPVGSRVVFYSDEPPGLDGDAPFEYAVLEEEAKRHFRFALVAVEGAEEENPP